MHSITHLYKAQRNRPDCNNHRGISLTGNILTRIPMSRLKEHLEQDLKPECGFRRGRSIIDMIFATRLLQEKFLSACNIAFIDLPSILSNGRVYV